MFTSKLWSATGAVVAVGRHRDYYVRLPSDHTYWRNRRYLKPVRPLVADPPSFSASCPPVPDTTSTVTMTAASVSPMAPTAQPAPAVKLIVSTFPQPVDNRRTRVVPYHALRLIRGIFGMQFCFLPDYAGYLVVDSSDTLFYLF